MYEGGYISRVFHFKIVKNYMIFVQQWMGAEGIGNASGLAASMTCHLKGPRELWLSLQKLVSSAFSQHPSHPP